MLTTRDFAQLRKMVDTPFGRIAAYEKGRGPAALFLHGYPLSAYHWRHQMEALSDVRRCIGIDLMGLGYSEPLPGADVAYPAQARMVTAVADALGLEEFDLVGNDSGGSIAQLVAVSDPDRIRTLTLTNCEVAENNPPAALMPVVELARAGGLAGLFGSIAEDVAGARQTLAAAFARPERAIDAERLAYDVRPLLASEDRKRWSNEFLSTLSADVTLGIVPALERFRRPTLVVWGDADVYMPVASARWLEAHVPGVERMVIVPDAKLFFPEEEPALLCRELRIFWSAKR